MRPEHWQRIEELFQSALERDPADRTAFLDGACAGDESLRREVESLIAADKHAGSFMEAEASGGAGDARAEDQGGSMIDQSVGPYKIISKLGGGGMGEVYLAEDTRLGRRVALKLLIEGLAADEEQKRRLVQEARAASALNHPHILTIYDIGSEAGRGFIAMEYVEGQTLRERLKTSGPLSTKQTVEVGVQLASAMARAHEAGIIHRDLKPENIMLRPDGYAKILDFGLAKLAEGKTRHVGSEDETAVMSRTTPGMVLGTPRYMSPEQARGEHVDHRSDIFSLGCALYEMATGQPPFSGDSVLDTLHAIIHDEPLPLTELNADVAPELESIVAKCLSKDRTDRYQHADEIEVDLRQLRLNIESGQHRASMLQGALKKRVPLALGLYFLFAWAMIQLVHWLVNRYVLSPYLEDLAFVTLLSLIPSVVLVAYFIRRPSQKRWRKLERIGVPVNVLAALVVLFLLFHGKQLGAATKTVTVQNEEGQRIQRTIPKSEFRKRLAVFFFDNQSGDASLDWLQYGMTQMIGFDLVQDLFLNVIVGYDVYDKMKEAGFPAAVGLPLTLKMKIADNLHLDHFVSGSFTKLGEDYSIKLSLHETKSGKVTAENTFAGSDLFRLADEITAQLKRDLQIPTGSAETAKEQPISAILTNSVTALHLCITGLNELRFNYNWQKASQYLEQAVNEDRTFALAHFLLYQVYLLSNQGEKRAQAIQSAMQHLYKYPERWAYLVTASYYEFKEDSEKRLSVVKLWVQIFPEDIEGHTVLAALYDLNNQPEEAISQCKLILELDPERFKFLQLTGQLYQERGQFEEALKYYKQYADRFPKDADSFVVIGDLYKDLGDYAQAKSNYENATILEPQKISILVKLAGVEFDSGNFDQAFKQCDDALSTCKTPQDRRQAYAQLSSFYEKKGQASKSLEHTNLMLAQDEKFRPPAYVLSEKLGRLNKYVRAGKSDVAFQMLTTIRGQLAPPFDKLVPLGYLGIYLELEDADKASEQLQGVENAIRALGAENLRFLVFHAQGRIQEIKGNYQDAISGYTKEFELDPTNAGINAHIGRCYRNLKRLDTADEYIQKTLRIYPFDATARYELALVYSDMGDREKALEQLRFALNVWKDADLEYKPAKRAREKLAELQSSPR